MAATCVRCKRPTAAGANFCGACGAPVVRRRGRAGWLLALVVAGGAGAAVATLAWRARQADLPPWRACPGGQCPALASGEGARFGGAGPGPLERVELHVPRGAIEAPTTIGFAPAPAEAQPPRMLDPEGEHAAAPLGPAVRLSPAGQRFRKAARLAVPFDPGKRPPGRDVAVVHWDGDRAERLAPLRVDADAGVIWVAVEHFSDVVAVVDPGRDAIFASVGPSDPERFGPSGWGPSSPPPAATEPSCVDTIRPTIVAEAAGDYRVYVSPALFWGGIGVDPGERTMLWYLYAEDGGAMSSLVTGADLPIKPIRSGGERELLRLLKAHVRGGGLRLTPAMILDLALRAVREADGGANLAAAAVAAHNVIRAISRADKWFNDVTTADGRPCPPEKPDCGFDPAVHRHFGHPPSDPLLPVLRDLIGAESVDDGPTFYEMVGGRGGANGPRDMTAIMYRPFDPDRGIFAEVGGARTAVHNGGAHYYHWVGQIARLFHSGTAATAGMWVERIVTKWPTDPVAGQVQGDELLRGRDIAACLAASRPAADVPPAPPPCPELPMEARKCPWSPDGHTVHPCPPGFCYDAGPTGFLACRQIELPPGAFLNSYGNPECPPGTVPERERCSPLMLRCAPASAGASPTAP